MIICKELNTESFSDKDALFLALKANKDAIIKAKKSTHKLSVYETLPVLSETSPSIPFATEEGYFYAIINSTNVMDSHNDVHTDSIWNKSAIEKNGKISYLVDHDFSVEGLVVHKSNVEIQLHKTTFKDLGYELEGNTTILVYKMRESDILHDKMAKIVSKRGQIENSVKMEYVTTVLCVNSDLEELKDEKRDYDKYISSVGNRAVVDEQGYFFAQTEAKIVDEGSAVLEGSNSSTHIIYHKEIEPLTNTHKNEPSDNGTQKIDYKSLLENFN